MKFLIPLILLFFTFQSTAQTQLGKDIDGEFAADEFGEAIAFSNDGKRIAIGARENDDSGQEAGHVRILQYTNGSWNQIGSDINGQAPGDEAGASVALSENGKRVAIGSNKNDSIGLNSGHVRIFEENAGVWNQVGNIINGQAEGDQFGFATSISADGKRVAIGAPYHNGNGINSGQVSIFQEIGGAWTQIGNSIIGDSSGDNSGFAISLSSNGKRIAIGAILNDHGGAAAGQARVFEENAGNWTQIGSDLDGEAPSDNYGNTVSLSADGKRLAVGGWKNDGNGQNAGHVQLFEEIAGAWNQIGNDIDGNTGDHLGFSTHLSADGQKVVVGAPLNDNAGSGAGVARVFEEINGTWSQLGNDISGESIGDRCGQSVALSPDGSKMAVGANYNDGGGFNSGHVRVFGVCCPIAAYQVELSALLEGPFDPTTSLMKDNLRSDGFIPLAEPYTSLGYTHIGGGGETTVPSVLNTTGPNAIVDWIFIELRAASDSTTAVATRSALLQADGDIVDLDGDSNVDFTNTGIGMGNYWIVLRHRTHIDAMSATPILIEGFCPGLYDFNASGAFNNSLKPLTNGFQAFYEGDVNQDGVINSFDRSQLWNKRNLTGYVEVDTNLDGVSNANDRSKNWNNRNQEAQIP